MSCGWGLERVLDRNASGSTVRWRTCVSPTSGYFGLWRLATYGCRPRPCDSPPPDGWLARPNGSSPESSGSIRNQNHCIAWFRTWAAKRRFGSCVKRPDANSFQFASQAQATLGQVVAAEAMTSPRTTQREGAVDQCQDRSRQAHGTTHGRFEQFLATTLQVSYALLMKGPCEAVVHAPAVMHQRARPVEPQQLFGRFVAPRGIDHITGCTLTDEGVQPGQASTDTPARFIRRDLRRATQVDSQLFVGGSTTLGRAQHRTDAGGSGEMQFGEQRPQQLHALAVRQAQLFVEHRQQGMHLWPELTGRGTAGRTGLQGVTTCDRAATVVARADMHVEAAIDHRPRDLGLVLHGDMRFADLRTRTVRARLRQRRVVGLVDPRRNAAMRVRTMSLARLATGRLRFRRPAAPSRTAPPVVCPAVALPPTPRSAWRLAHAKPAILAAVGHTHRNRFDVAPHP